MGGRESKQIDLPFASKIWAKSFQSSNNFQMKIIFIRKLMFSWLLGISLNPSQTTNFPICIQFLFIETDTSQCEATFWSNLTKTKKSPENELKSIICPSEFWHTKIPLFQKNYIGRSLIVPKQILVWIPPWAWDFNWKQFLCVKKNDSSFVPIGLLTKIIIFQSDRII